MPWIELSLPLSLLVASKANRKSNRTQATTQQQQQTVYSLLTSLQSTLHVGEYASCQKLLQLELSALLNHKQPAVGCWDEQTRYFNH